MKAVAGRARVCLELLPDDDTCLIITKTGCQQIPNDDVDIEPRSRPWTSPGDRPIFPLCVVHITTKAFLTCLKVLPRIMHRCARTHANNNNIKAAVRPKASGCATEIYSDALFRLSTRYSPQAGEMHFSLKRVAIKCCFLFCCLY